MDEPLIAVRIKDGIFVGNATAAHDDDFLMTNKISHVLNCAGSEVKDLFGNVGVKYLTFHWKDAAAVQGLNTHSGVMFDPSDANINDTVRFLDQGMADGECVLVHDVHGTSRACALVAAYFVVKYGWKLDNALAFMQMAHQEMEIKPHWMKQLRAFAKKHDVDVDVFDPEIDDKRFSLDNDQWMLRNTLLNGLTANIQDGNALYQQCATEAPPLESTTRAQQTITKRKRIMFIDTHQGTHVDSYSTTPVVNASSSSSSSAATKHHDPMAPSTSSAPCPSYLGGGGIGAIIDSRRSVVESIVARRSPVNTRRLESGSDVNAKGRQKLFRRLANQPQYGGTHVHLHSGEGSTINSNVGTPRSATPLGGVQRVSSSLGAEVAQQRSAALAHGLGSSTSSLYHDNKEEGMTHRNPTPQHAHTNTTTPLRTSTTVQRHAPSVNKSNNTISHSLSNTTPIQRPPSPLVRRASSGIVNDPANTSTSSTLGGAAITPLRGSSAITPVRQPLRSATTGTVRSPFSIGSSGVAPRKGSPLPRQSTNALPTASSQQRQASPTVRREVQSSGYGYGQIAPRTGRPSSPAPQGPPPSSTMGRYSSVGNINTAAGSSVHSPFVQRGAMSSRPQSPTQQQQQQRFTNSGSSLYGNGPSNLTTNNASSGGGVVRRAMSPRTVGSAASSSSSAITGGAGSSSIQPGLSSSSTGTGIRRANSPLTKTRIGSGYQSPLHNAANGMSAYSTASPRPTASSPRPNSPLQRGSSPAASGGVAGAGVRPSSPSRRPTTLADQYLAGGAGGGTTISRGGNAAHSNVNGIHAPTASSIARRNSPTPVTRRY